MPVGARSLQDEIVLRHAYKERVDAMLFGKKKHNPIISWRRKRQTAIK